MVKLDRGCANALPCVACAAGACRAHAGRALAALILLLGAVPDDNCLKSLAMFAIIAIIYKD
jgi:hypothetical protein